MTSIHLGCGVGGLQLCDQLVDLGTGLPIDIQAAVGAKEGVQKGSLPGHGKWST